MKIKITRTTIDIVTITIDDKNRIVSYDCVGSHRKNDFTELKAHQPKLSNGQQKKIMDITDAVISRTDWVNRENKPKAELVIKQSRGRHAKKKYHYTLALYFKYGGTTGVNVKADNNEDFVNRVNSVYFFRKYIKEHIANPDARFYLYVYENARPRGKKLKTLDFLKVWRYWNGDSKA